MTDTGKLYWSAIETFGEDLQIAVTIEEMAELTKELCKAQRVTFVARGGLGDGLIDNHDEIAEEIEKKLHDDLNLKCVIGIGTTAKHLRVLADKYKEAQVAIEVGKVFDTEKSIIHYDNLGIGRLIYQLPTTLCEMFLSEVFKKNPIEALDQETLYTINKFFENNLNVSETSRKLFVHRNTLVYRLEKIKKLTGLDLREFDDAITFKVALMVKKYLTSRGIDA